MKSVIIPVDFSDTSLNSARFVAAMLSGHSDTSVVLYHNYESEADRDIGMSYLESLKRELLEKGDSKVEYIMEMGGNLVENIDRLAHTSRATLIAMGITGRTSMGQVLMGSNTLKLVENTIYPVLIIPPNAKYEGLSNVAFASDFSDVNISTPETFISLVLDMFNPKLHIVNVNPDHYISINEHYQQQKEILKQMFIKYDTEFYFIGMNDFHEAIDNFIKDYKVDMLITVPRHHPSAKNMFRNTHTKRLAYHSHIPILAAHQ
jgi:nucleotide-binding universal stress UspA family protein